MKLQKVTYEPVNPGIYDAVVIKAEDAVGQFGPQVAFSFDLGENRQLRGWASGKLSPRSKLGGWTLALLGDMPEELDTATLVGKRCRVKVEMDTKADGNEFSKIVDVLAPRKAKPVVVEAAPTCAECGQEAVLYDMDGRPLCKLHSGMVVETEAIPF